MITYKVRTYSGSKLRERIDSLNIKEIANIVRDDINKNFDKGQNADGSKMKSLNPETIKIKKKRGGINPSKPLIFKGGTQKGIKSQTITPKEAVIISTGNAKGYYGGSTSGKDVLRFQRGKGRDPFGVSKNAIRAIRKYIIQWLTKK